MIDSGEVDLILIATPHFTHPIFAQRAFGKVSTSSPKTPCSHSMTGRPRLMHSRPHARTSQT